MDIPPQPAATSTPDVLVLTRVVAAGVVEHENKTGVKEKFLRASLCLLPAPDPNPCNSPGANPNGAACTAANPDPSTWGPSDYSGTALKVSLQNWPEEIENHLKDGKVTLSVLPIAATSTNGSILPNNLDAAVKTEWDCVIPSRSQTINSVNRLWQQLMAPTTNPGDASVHDPSRKILTTYRTYYDSAVKAFHDPWAQLKIALAHSLAGRHIVNIPVNTLESRPLRCADGITHLLQVFSITRRKVVQAYDTLIEFQQSLKQVRANKARDAGNEPLLRSSPQLGLHLFIH